MSPSPEVAADELEVGPAALLPATPPVRKIIHVDMDAFYASVEQRDDPALRGRPVAVGGGGPRGVVMAASYEARLFGVRSAMPGFQARRLCPELIFVRTRFDAYHAASRQIRAIFRSYTDLVEPLSLDEAYLDVTAPKRGPPSATGIARGIKREILAETGLTASAGVSFNKFLAKVASDLDKPDGLYVIRPEDAHGFIAQLPIERFFGIGPVTARKMRDAGIHDGADLRARSEAELVNRFGKVGRHYFRIARGQDERAVSPDRPYKSIGAEETFATDLTAPAAMLEALRPIAERVAERMAGADLFGRTVTLKLKHHDFSLHTRQYTLADPVHSAEELMQLARWLLHTPAPPAKPVRLLGLTASNFGRAAAASAPVQLSLAIGDLAPLPAPALDPRSRDRPA
jgi:DNA polymerase IV